jgi:hypothetical protein
MTTPTPPATPAAGPSVAIGTAATATKLGSVPIYVQPPFDHRLTWTLPYPFLDTSGTGTNNLRRGFMQWDTSIAEPDGYNKKDPNYPATFNFLFNPSTISTSYQIASGQAQAAMMYGSASGVDQSLLLPLQQQTSFTLMFDRTYELNDPTSSTLMKNFGVDMDIAALRQYTGMYAGVYTQGANTNANFSTFTSNNTEQSTAGTPRTNPNQVSKSNGPTGQLSQGVMQVTLGYIYFSGPTSTPATSNGYGISYYGYVDSWSVEYTHFTVNMIPLRAVVDISFTFLPPPIAMPDPGAATKAAVQQDVNGSGLSSVQIAAIKTAENVGIAGR